MRHSTATDDPVHGDAGKKSCFGLRDGRKFQVRYNEADVSFPIVSIGEAPQQGKVRVWSRLSSVVARRERRVSQDMCEGPRRGKVGNWLPCSATEHTDGAPLCPNPRMARLAVEAPPISVPVPDATRNTQTKMRE